MRDALHTHVAWRQAQTLETLWVAQHLTPLFGHRGDLTGALVLPRHRHRQDLLGFFSRGHTAEGRETKRHTTCILRLAHPMPLGHPAKRCDGIGADRHAHVIQPQGGGGFQLVDKRGATFPAQRGGGHRRTQRLTLCQGGVREPLPLDNLLARPQAGGIAAKARDERFACGELSQARPQLGEGRTRRGTAAGRQREDAVCPRAQAVHIHTAGFRADFGRYQTRQNGVLEVARDAPTGGHKGLKGGVSVGGALAHRGHGVSNVVDARAGQAFLLQEGDGFAQIPAPVFAVGGRAAQLGDEAAEQVGNRFTCLGIGYGDSQTVDPVESKSPGRQGMVLGVNGQDGQHLAHTQTNADIHHPDEARTAGGRVQGAALQQASGIAADQRESRDPIDDRLRTRGFRDATPRSEELEHTRHGTKADPYLSKEP
jgi:hypothetical protein